MAAVDRNVLRLAVYELEHGDTPATVILDEAVELARRFGDDPSPAFVNGVLDAVARSVRAAELHETPRRRARAAANPSPGRERRARHRARDGSDRARARRSRDRLLLHHGPAAARRRRARRLAAVRAALAADRRRPRRRPRRRGGPAARRGRPARAPAARARPRSRARRSGLRPRRRSPATPWGAAWACARRASRSRSRAASWASSRCASASRPSSPGPARRSRRARGGAALRLVLVAGRENGRAACSRSCAPLRPAGFPASVVAAPAGRTRRAGRRPGPRALAACRARGRLPSSNRRAGRSSLSRAVQERATCARRCSENRGARPPGGDWDEPGGKSRGPGTRGHPSDREPFPQIRPAAAALRRRRGSHHPARWAGARAPS